LVRLHRKGVPVRRIAHVLAMGPETERKYRKALQRAGVLAGEAAELPELAELRSIVEAAYPRKYPPQERSTAEPYRVEIEAMVRLGAEPRAIYDKLRLDEPELDVSYHAIKRLCRRLRKARPVREGDVALHVVTKPGDVAQVDFGYIGRVLDEDGVLRKAWVFVLVLGHSRAMYAHVVFDQRAVTWQHLHCLAFEALGGVPHTLVPDNLKAAVILAAFGLGDDKTLNRSYRELARHYDFIVDPTPAYSPEKKGKVESGVSYLKRSFCRPRDLTILTLQQVNDELTKWVDEIANRRTHGTTGRVPAEQFAEDLAVFHPLPQARYTPVVWRKAKVHRDGHVCFDRRLYSVPWTLLGKEVWLRATPSTVDIRHDDERVATHPRSEQRRTTDPLHLPAGRAELLRRDRGHWQERADAIGPETGAYVRDVFASDRALSKLSTVQKIVLHLESFERQRAEGAARRAAHYASYGYGSLKRILEQGLDLLPLDEVSPPTSSTGSAPRFARSPNDFLQTVAKMEASRELN
jgi:transposase